MSSTLLAFPIGVTGRVVSMRRWIAGASVALLLMSGGALAGAGPANAAQLGSLAQNGHLKPFCEKFVITEVASKWNVSASPDNPWNPYTWKCRWLPLIPGRSIDMNAACRYFYGRGAYAIATNKNWAWDSWKCFR